MDERARELRREYQRQYREENREKVNKAKREWREKNAEKVREKARAWSQANPDKVRKHKERYWMRKAEQSRPTCLQCGEAFEAKRSDAKYCSTRCRVAFSRNK